MPKPFLPGHTAFEHHQVGNSWIFRGLLNWSSKNLCTPLRNELDSHTANEEHWWGPSWDQHIGSNHEKDLVECRMPCCGVHALRKQMRLHAHQQKIPKQRMARWAPWLLSCITRVWKEQTHECILTCHHDSWNASALRKANPHMHSSTTDAGTPFSTYP